MTDDQAVHIARELFGQELPKELSQSVVRYFRTMSPLRRSTYDRHPDFASVVRWAREYPLPEDHKKYSLQQNLLMLDEVRAEHPYAFAVVFRIRAVMALFTRRRIKAEDATTNGRRPGDGLLRVGRFLLGEKRAKDMLEPALGDMHEEYYAAKAAGHHWQARMARARGYFFALRPFAEFIAAAVRWLFDFFGPK